MSSKYTRIRFVIQPTYVNIFSFDSIIQWLKTDKAFVHGTNRKKTTTQTQITTYTKSAIPYVTHIWLTIGFAHIHIYDDETSFLRCLFYKKKKLNKITRNISFTCHIQHFVSRWLWRNRNSYRNSIKFLISKTHCWRWEIFNRFEYNIRSLRFLNLNLSIPTEFVSYSNGWTLRLNNFSSCKFLFETKKK